MRLVVGVLWWAGIASVTIRGAEPARPVAVDQANPAPEWDAKFMGKEGWIGGDGVYSAVLGPRKVLWLFGDTLLGTVKSGRRVRAVMVNNTVGVQVGRPRDAAIRFVAGKTKEGKPAAFFTLARQNGCLWPQAAIRVADRLFVFLAQIERTQGGGAFGFKPVGQWLFVVDNPDDDPHDWKMKRHRLSFAVFGPARERSWGSAVLEHGGHLYVYGYDEMRSKRPGGRRLTVARVPANRVDDFRAWRFRTSEDWSEKPADAAPLADGLATEFSVSWVPGAKGYLAVYTENGLGRRIIGRVSPNPEGPWSAPVLLYLCPEMAKDRRLFSYAAKAHAWAGTQNEVLVSYCVNAWDFARLFADQTVYRPKFVRVKLGQ
jgi:hypothetical protein